MNSFRKRNKIQRRREDRDIIKDKFIESTKDLIRSEGLKSVSARKVAEKAGYSYATLYNYFKDINELIFYCVKDFECECIDYIESDLDKSLTGKEMINTKVRNYIRYFIEYPGIFELFFLERMDSLGNKREISDIIYNLLDKLCEEDWMLIIATGEMSHEEATRSKLLLKNYVMGALLFYENRYQPDSYNELLKFCHGATWKHYDTK